MPKKLIDMAEWDRFVDENIATLEVGDYDDGFCDGLGLAVQFVDALPLADEPRWIPVTERLPEYYKRVLVYVAQFTCERVTYINTIVMAYLTDIGFICCKYGELLCGVAHWMPLPEPPKKRRNNGTHRTVCYRHR